MQPQNDLSSSIPHSMRAALQFTDSESPDPVHHPPPTNRTARGLVFGAKILCRHKNDFPSSHLCMVKVVWAQLATKGVTCGIRRKN